jgi:integrase
VNGKQVEKSFKDTTHPTTGRVSYGSGRKLAQDWQLKTTVDKRSGDITFADHGRMGKENFGKAVEAHISHLAVKDVTKTRYTHAYSKHIKPVFGDKTLAQVASDRDGVLDLLTVTMKGTSLTLRQHVRLVITGTVEEAVKAGKLSKHNLGDIKLADDARQARNDFVFPTFEQVKIVANGLRDPHDNHPLKGARICVWLMRGCGLRIEEALGTEKSDFIEDGTVLRVTWQASPDGTKKTPLKKRKQGEYRDVPVPSWLWELVKDLPDGPLMPGNDDRPYERYKAVYSRFLRAAEAAGIAEGFTPHSLRHAYASAMLARGVQITELAHYLGHRDINTTHAVYGHLLPSAAKRAVAALDAEYAQWSTGTTAATPAG